MADQSVKRVALGDLKRGQEVMKGLKTVVDLVFLIDGTGSMQNALDAVKARALTLYKDIIYALKDKKRIVSTMRVKVVIFRDLYVDSVAYEESDYFILSDKDDDESAAFRDYVSGIRACGGGDEPEHALEALHRALKLNYTQPRQGMKARHIIVLMTDASAHPLDDPQRSLPEYRDIYPGDMPKTMPELNAEWEMMDDRARRLIIFAPNAYPWPKMGTWSGASHEVSEAGKGISETVFEKVIATISGSV